MIRAATLLALLCITAQTAAAHPDDYIDETFVYQTVEPHEMELETWFELRAEPAGDHAAWFTSALEYGITERWMADIAAQAVDDGAVHFGRLRLETRYRFADEGVWPVDLATSLEYELERDPATGELGETLTPRLVVSKDVIPSVNTTVNLDFPVRLDDGTVSFAYAVGVRYPARARLRVGAEARHDVRERKAALFPQIWFVPVPSWGLVAKLGVSIGLTSATDPWVGRLSLELEL